jgi:hypothetical protein
MFFFNLEKVGRDFTLSGKEFHNFIVEGKKDLELVCRCLTVVVPISIEYIIFECNEISQELNTLLFKSVQKFIRQTCRFNNYYPQP